MKSPVAPSVTAARTPAATTPAAPQPPCCAGLVPSDRAAREEILHRARGIWEKEGRPHDRAHENWSAAEEAVLRPPEPPAAP